MTIAITKNSKDRSVICYIAEEININSSPLLKKALSKFIAKKLPKLVIDLAKTTYIDSSGLAMLIELFKEVRSYRGKLELANLPPRIKNIFEIKKLDKLFTIVS
jgi:anti-sigma B factor antagonist